ncbi:MAG: type II toxin-antitoxin system RelE/ParE family toxin [Proteobacteria bacterium]|nr:type II toxin-antitoxin system RelE/ParE family toxin [Pseudomonadota bacterium]
MWQITYQPRTIKTLKKLDSASREKILNYLENASQSPEAFGKALSNNLKGFWRYRVGDYRIICDLRKKELLVLVIDIGHRSAIYKK